RSEGTLSQRHRWGSEMKSLSCVAHAIRSCSGYCLTVTSAIEIPPSGSGFQKKLFSLDLRPRQLILLRLSGRTKFRYHFEFVDRAAKSPLPGVPCFKTSNRSKRFEVPK